MKTTLYKSAFFLGFILTLGLSAQAFANSVELLPYADETYTYTCEATGDYYDWCAEGDPYADGSISSGLSVRDTRWIGCTCCPECWDYRYVREGIIEFDISSLEGLFQPGQIQANIILTNKSSISQKTFYLADMFDQNEDGTILINDIIGTAYIGGISGSFNANTTHTFDVTSALEHDLFDSGQTNFSGFVLYVDHLSCFYILGCFNTIDFYDHTSSDYTPRLIVSGATLIELSSFTATSGSGNVILRWITASEIDNAGFNLYRSESKDGEYVKINASLIPAQGSPTQGATYQFIDENVRNRTTYYYKLEDIDLNGTSIMHGPVSAEPRAIGDRDNR
jgi:hypothetical protein